MAEVHMVSRAITELLRRAKAAPELHAVRGEFFLHTAHTLDLVAASDSVGESADRLRAEAQVYREQGRSILGPVG